MSNDVSPEFLKKLEGYGLTTAEIEYGLPDYPDLLQLFIWQEYDVYPKMPRLVAFLGFWQRELDGPIRRVRFAHACALTPVEFKLLSGEYRLH